MKQTNSDDSIERAEEKQAESASETVPVDTGCQREDTDQGKETVEDPESEIQDNCDTHTDNRQVCVSTKVT